MMFKVRKIQLFTLGILIVLFLVPCIKVKAEENKVAVIYDTYNEFGSDENKLSSLVRLVLSTGKGADIISVNSYSKNSIAKYEVLVVLYNNSSELPKGFVQDLLKFNGKILWIGKNFNGLLEASKNINYIPKFSSKDESYSILEKYVNKYISGKEKKEENIYLLIDKVYPFIDLNGFIDKVDFLYDQGIPFICSVMPVYENQDFDAMKRFCEVLRYAQSKGGKIILHSSVFYGGNISGKDVKNKMDLAQQIYIKYGVYPLAVDVPEGFLYKEDYKDLIYSSNNIFIEKDKQTEIFDMKKYSIAKFEKVIDKIDVKDEYRYETPESTNNIAFSFNSDLDLDGFKDRVSKIINKRISFSDMNHLNTVMKLGGMELSCNASNILLNNKPVNEQNNITESKPKAKIKNENIDISVANGKIIKITSIICAFFVIVVLVSMRIDRKKFFNYRG